jgi:uncharacterized membrane protein
MIFTWLKTGIVIVLISFLAGLFLTKLFVQLSPEGDKPDRSRTGFHSRVRGVIDHGLCLNFSVICSVSPANY